MEVISASSNGINKALEVLRQGGVVAHATETCYGLACDLTNLEAVARLFELKKRPIDQPVSALFASIDDAKKYVEWNERAEELAKKYLPGPLTLILPLKPSPPFPLSLKGEGERGGEGETVGIRISSHPVAMELAKRFGKPLSTTSANVHGKANTYSAEEVKKQFSIINSPHFAKPACRTGGATRGRQLSILVLDSGTLPKNSPSTIIDLTKRGSPLVRGGEITLRGKDLKTPFDNKIIP